MTRNWKANLLLAAGAMLAAGTVRSYRYDESVRIPCLRAADRTATGSHVATSTSTSVVPAVTDVPSPPITPASDTGPTHPPPPSQTPPA